MRLLLDTHIILWAVSDAEKLSDKAKCLIQQADQLYVSSASIWEIAIKSRLGKLDIDMPLFLHELSSQNVFELPVRWQHAQQIKMLETHHRDPFDHLLIAQAMTEPLILMTHDKILRRYSELVMLV